MRRDKPPLGMDVVSSMDHHANNRTPEWRGYLQLLAMWKSGNKSRRRFEAVMHGWTLDKEFNDFIQVLWEVGPRPSENHFIHMINPCMGKFTFGNIKWMTNTERKARRKIMYRRPEYYALLNTPQQVEFDILLESLMLQHESKVEKREREKENMEELKRKLDGDPDEFKI